MYVHNLSLSLLLGPGTESAHNKQSVNDQQSNTQLPRIK